MNSFLPEEKGATAHCLLPLLPASGNKGAFLCIAKDVVCAGINCLQPEEKELLRIARCHYLLQQGILFFLCIAKTGGYAPA